MLLARSTTHVLFTSYEFILLFLPATLLLVYGASALNRRNAAKAFLLLASFVFYAWWNPPFLGFLIILLAFNFFIGRWLSRSHGKAGRGRTAVLVAGLAVNLCALGYFKYTNFFV